MAKMPPPVLVTSPAESPVTLADLKSHGIIDFSDDDVLLQGMLDAAVSHFDGYSGWLGRCIVSQGWRQDYPAWCDELLLPFPDCSSMTISYYDANGASQTVSSDLYEVLEGVLGTYVAFKDAFTEPTLDDDRKYPVSIAFTAGYGAASAVPANISRAIMRLTDHFYNDRGGENDIPKSVYDMASGARRVGI